MSVLLLCFFNNVHGQIVINQSSYPTTVLGIDSIKIASFNTPYPSFAPAINGIWDLSILTDSSSSFFAWRVPTIAYQFADSNTYSLAGFNYKGNEQFSITSSGLTAYGIQIPNAQYSITSLTGILTDSLFIDSQTDLYSALRNKILFPATYNSNWTSTYKQDLSYHITCFSSGYIDTPGIIRTYTTQIDTVIGYGQMRINDATGSPSDYLKVLQVHTIIAKIDSYFLNGNVAGALILSVFRGYQGKKDTVYQENFYRIGEITPFAQVTFADNGYLHITKILTHMQRLVNNIPNIAANNNIVVYPNPIINNNVTIFIPPDLNLCTYKLFTIDNKLISNGSISAGINNLTISNTTGVKLFYLYILRNGIIVDFQMLQNII